MRHLIFLCCLLLLLATSSYAQPDMPPDLPQRIADAWDFTSSENTDWEPIAWTFADDPAEAEMMLVPAGCFDMGTTEADVQEIADNSPFPAEAFLDEAPQHQQCITAPYWIDRTEVTRAQYNRCVDAGSCREAPASSYSTGENQPINRVTWSEAQAYCRWRGEDFRLPTEKQWEYAARGVESLVYPWGNEFDPDLVVWEANANNLAAEVGSIPEGASWVGAQDMVGNMWEWTSSLSQPYFYTEDTHENPDLSGLRSLRGGSFANPPVDMRSANRLGFSPNLENFDWGFRCVREGGRG